jgi:hypothetical protein
VALRICDLERELTTNELQTMIKRIESAVLSGANKVLFITMVR